MSVSTPKVRRQVLVVDDNPLVTHSLATLLADDGFEVMSFTEAPFALRYLKDNRPDIAIIDVHLAECSGLEVCQHIRDQYGQEVPIIMLSGDTSMKTLRALPEAGANYFLSKPVHSAQLRAFIKEFSLHPST